MNNSKKRIITDCAICAALTVILTVAAIYVPPIWFITYFVCGTPVAYIVFKHGLSAGVITALCAVLSVMAVVNIGVGVIAAAAVYILPALVFSGCYKKFGANGFYSTLCSAAIVYLIIFTLLARTLNGDGNGIRDMLTASAGSVTESFKQSFAAAGRDFSSFEKIFSDAFEMTIEMILRYIPAILICASAVSAYIMIMINIFIIKRFTGANIEYPPFCTIGGTRRMCFATMIAYVVALLSGEKSIIGITAANAAAIFTAAFTICGLSTVDFMFRNKVQSGYARAAIYVGTMVIGFPLLSLAAEIIAFLGFFDAMNSIRSFIIFVNRNTNIRNGNILKRSDRGEQDSKHDNPSDSDRSDGNGNNERRQ